MDKRTERLIEAIRWLVFSGRRPGALGRTTAFIGSSTSEGNQRMELSADGWRGPEGQLLEDKELVEGLASAQFGLRAVGVIPEVAPLLFQGAIEQVEAAQFQLMEAIRDRQDGEDDDEGQSAFQFMVATSALDKSLRCSSASITLSLAAAEAQVNAWAEMLGGWALQENGRAQDWLPLVDKLVTLAARKGSTLDKTGGPLSELGAAVRQRNDLVHSKPVEQSLPLGSREAREPARWLCTEARRAALAVRKSLVMVAGVLGENPPHYLIYCPEADPADETKWLSVAMLTGTRDDSVFPRVSDRLQRASPDDADTESSG